MRAERSEGGDASAHDYHILTLWGGQDSCPNLQLPTWLSDEKQLTIGKHYTNYFSVCCAHKNGNRHQLHSFQEITKSSFHVDEQHSVTNSNSFKVYKNTFVHWHPSIQYATKYDIKDTLLHGNSLIFIIATQLFSNVQRNLRKDDKVTAQMANNFMLIQLLFSPTSPLSGFCSMLCF